MAETYDIFKRVPDGSLWIQSVEGIDQAKQQLEELCAESPGEYFAYDAPRAAVVAELSSSRGSAPDVLSEL